MKGYRLEYQKEYQKKYRQKNLLKILFREREHYNEIRNACISHYSKKGMVCLKCKCNDIRVLVIDHIDNSGAQLRKTLKASSIYAWLVKNNFPEGFQVLCHNCNWLKERVKNLNSGDFLLEEDLNEL